MTDDLLDRLKEAHRLWRRPLLREAADRIEQLEAALREIAQHDMQAIAIDALRPSERAALEGKDA